MYRDHRVAVVVPAYNEAGLVGDVLAAMPEFVDRVYAVEDRSTDGTWTELRDLVAAERDGSVGADDEPGADAEAWSLPAEGVLARRVEEVDRGGRVVALRHAVNQGAGGAVKTGYLAALAGSADLVATVDGDGQMDPSILPRFLDPLVDGEAGYATGTRFARPGDCREMPPFRRVGNAALTRLARVATGFRELSDPVNGYTAATVEALEAIDVAGLHEGYGYGIDVLGALRVAGVRAVDVPHVSRYGAETSSIRYQTYVPRVSRLLVRVGARRVRSALLRRLTGAIQPSRVGSGEDAGDATGGQGNDATSGRADATNGQGGAPPESAAAPPDAANAPSDSADGAARTTSGDTRTPADSR